MPNKSIKHIELDKAIKDFLLSLPVKSNVEWEELQELLYQKQQNVNPLTGVPLNLNTMVVAGTTGSLPDFSNTANIFRKWSGSLYYITGTIAVVIGGYCIFDSSTSKKSTKPEIKKEQVNDFQPSVNSTGPASSTSPSASESPASFSASEIKPGSGVSSIGSSTETGSRSGKGINSGNEINPASEIKSGKSISEKEVLVKTQSKTEKNPTVKENSDPSSEASPVVNRRDTSSAFDGQEAVPKNSKVLYYKESLTLDKLEQELTKEKKDSVK